MRKAKCTGCGQDFPLNSLYSVNDKHYCEPCGNNAYAEAQKYADPINVVKLTDPTVCARCEADGGSMEYATTAGAPMCHTCREHVYNWPFPLWLRAGLALTCALLIFALVVGDKYFKAGRNLYRGTRLVDTGQYEAAIPLLKPVVSAAPNCEKCILLLAIAHLKSGDPAAADIVIQAHNGGRFSNDESLLVDKVKEQFSHYDRAAEFLKAASEQDEKGDTAAAEASIRQAHAAYPEWKVVDVFEADIQAGKAFTAKDYPAFLAIERKQMEQFPDNAMRIAGVASALAAMYASTNDDQYRVEAEQLLSRAKQLSTTQQMKDAYAEYEERILYRLRTKDIIDKPEYDKRFRPQQLAKKEAN